MDFGEILEQWERETAKPGAFRRKGKQTSGPAPGEEDQAPGESEKAPPGKDPAFLSRWLDMKGIYDKDADGEDSDLSPGEKRHRLLVMRPDAEIDLHGLNREEAWASLEHFFTNAKQQGFLKISVIHGKGNHSEGEAILKRTVREFIERCPFAGESGHRDSRSGGTGATWVLLKLANARGK
jgi:DNA-nicking Smr family endonuclease